MRFRETKLENKQQNNGVKTMENQLENNNNNKQRGNKMVSSNELNEIVKTNPYGIKTPTSVEEFRENLQKYYVCNELKGKPHLCIQSKYIPIDEISSFNDIYTLTKSGFGDGGDGLSPSLSPMITMKKDIRDWMDETSQTFSFKGYFYVEENYTLWDNKNEFISNGKPKWFQLDNQMIRDFYHITLGKFCGYGGYSDVVSVEEETEVV